MSFNKRGQVVELGFGIVFFFLFAVAMVFVFKATSQINSNLQNNTMLINQSKDIMASNVSSFPSVFDSGGVLILVGIWIFCLVAAYNSQNNPLWGALSILVLVILGFVSMVLANVYASIYEVTSEASSFPMMGFLLQHYLIVLLIIGGSTLMVLFVSNRGGV